MFLSTSKRVVPGVGKLKLLASIFAGRSTTAVCLDARLPILDDGDAREEGELGGIRDTCVGKKATKRCGTRLHCCEMQQALLQACPTQRPPASIDRDFTLNLN